MSKPLFPTESCPGPSRRRALPRAALLAALCPVATLAAPAPTPLSGSTTPPGTAPTTPRSSSSAPRGTGRTTSSPRTTRTSPESRPSARTCPAGRTWIRRGTASCWRCPCPGSRRAAGTRSAPTTPPGTCARTRTRGGGTTLWGSGSQWGTRLARSALMASIRRGSSCRSGTARRPFGSGKSSRWGTPPRLQG
jgi:hypothetical protein